MTERWTPGPWEAHFGNDYVAVKPIDHAARVADVVEAVCGFTPEETEANARLIAQSPRFADIAARAQYLANERDGDYGALTKDELCAFMVEFDEALSDARGEP